MRLTFDNMLRVHRREITPADAFAEQARAEVMPLRHGAPPTIPSILHFIWLGDEFPVVRHLRSTVTSLYPDWQVMVWTEPPADWPQPWADAYARCPDHARRADVLRVWALLQHGGIYYDSDFVGVRPLPTRYLRTDFAAALLPRCTDPAATVQALGTTGSLANGLMVSMPGGPTITRIAALLLAARPTTWQAMGAAILATVYRETPFPVIPPDLVFPGWQTRTFARAWQHAFHQPKPPAECAVHLWMARGGWHQAQTAFAREAGTVATVSQGILASRLLRSLRSCCIRNGLPLRAFRPSQRPWRNAANIVTWGIRLPPDGYTGTGRNVLYTENGLLCQRSGVYVDHAGYFCDSSIATEPQPDPTAREIADLHAHVRTRFSWPWFAGGNPDGPIMIACQIQGDCSTKYHYGPGRNAAQTLLDACADYLPRSVPVIVRPHPRAADAISPDWLRPDWTIDRSRCPYQRLRTCRALVTISSTLATEALALGLPVACLGRSAWEGHNVVLECATDYSRLAGLPDWQPEEWPVLRYLCAVLRHQLPYDATPDQVQANPSVRTWLHRAGHPVQTHTLADQATNAATRIRAAGDPSTLALLSAIETKLATCKTCSSARLQRSIIDLAEAPSHA